MPCSTSAHLCSRCEEVFNGRAAVISNDGFRVHHQDYYSFFYAKQERCRLCCELWIKFLGHKSLSESSPKFTELVIAYKTGMLPQRGGYVNIFTFRMFEPEKEERPTTAAVSYDPEDGWKLAEYAQLNGKLHFSFRVHGVQMSQTNIIDNRTTGALGPKSSSPPCRQLALRWLKECTTKHTKCSQSTSDFMPTRVLDISLAGAKTIKLVTSNPDDCQPYATLSYCWGLTNHAKLTAETSEKFFNNIIMSTLPRTFRNAVAIVRDLGLRFLWVDSLCIYQDSVDDWREQSAMMGDVYKYGFINIAASASKDSEGGLFFDREAHLVQPLQVLSRFPPHDLSQPIQHFDVCDFNPYEALIQRAPLNSRGWVMQERVMSPRILHCTSAQILWECRESFRSEAYPESLPCATADKVKEILRDLEDKIPQSVATERRQRLAWFNLIEEYTACNLTRDTDLFIALSGIAKAWGDATNGVYMAGLWREDLELGLLWHHSLTKFLRASSRRPAWRAPSWSWASYTGPVEWSSACSFTRKVNLDVRRRVLVAEITSAECQQIDRENSIGYKGRLKIQGIFLWARYRERPVAPIIGSTINHDHPEAGEWPLGEYGFLKHNTLYEIRLSVDGIYYDGIACFDYDLDYPSLRAEDTPTTDYTVAVMPVIAVQEVRIEQLAERAGDSAFGRPYLSIEGLIVRLSGEADGDANRWYERAGYFRVSCIETELDGKMREEMELMEGKTVAEVGKILRFPGCFEEILMD